MSVKPLVAVVGRPNVGKSTFFNRVCSKRISIVKDTPGVTRDRIYADAEWCGHVFTLIDTGGIELKSSDEMYIHIKKQAQIAIDTAEVIIFFVDGREGLVASDHDVADILRGSGKNVILAVNKLDNFELEKTYEFYELGLGEPMAVSCEHGKGVGDLLDEVVKHFSKSAENESSGGVKIALVGKPNVGKSSLLNKLLGFERVIVSPVAGTTRDAIDTPLTFDGKSYTLIDTAGMRRMRSYDDDSLEDYSVMRSISAIRRADVVLVVMSAEEDISEQDVRIAGFVHEEGKPGIIVMNKWDIVEKDTHTIEKFKEKLNSSLSFMDYFQSVFVSAKTGLRVEKLISLADGVFERASFRVPTGALNDVIGEAVSLNPPPSPSGRRLKILYSTQAETNPPKFVIFVNDEKLVHFSYRRYLENCIRKAFDFSGTPIKLIFNNRKDSTIN